MTFHTRIKSSGYSNATARTQQLGRSISAPRSGKRVPAAAKTTDRSNVNSRIRPYPKECLPFTVHQAHNDYPPKQSNTPFTPIMNATFSPDGALLGLVTGGNAVCTLKAPLGRFKGEGLSSCLHVCLFSDDTGADDMDVRQDISTWATTHRSTV